MVVKASPSLTTTASPPVALGARVRDTATFTPTSAASTAGRRDTRATPRTPWSPSLRRRPRGGDGLQGDPDAHNERNHDVNLGGAVADRATIARGHAPRGKITFRLYGRGDSHCSKAPVFVAAKAVSGNGRYTSPTFKPTLPGIYRWRAFYSGDSDNTARAGPCNAPGESVSVTRAR